MKRHVEQDIMLQITMIRWIVDFWSTTTTETSTGTPLQEGVISSNPSNNNHGADNYHVNPISTTPS